MTRVIYTNNKPFKPSIKLEPFINISKQKEVKKILKTAFSSKLSKKLIKVGGQNPIEPAKCGCKIYHGPYISNFKEIYGFLTLFI